MGSVSSCSGEGRARGEMSTRAAAQRKVATVVCTSVISEFECRGTAVSVVGVDTGELENELRDRGKAKLEEGGRLNGRKSVMVLGRPSETDNLEDEDEEAGTSRRSGSTLSMIGRKEGVLAEAG